MKTFSKPVALWGTVAAIGLFVNPGASAYEALPTPGTVRGTVTFKGTPPPPKLFELAKSSHPKICGGTDNDGKGNRTLTEVAVNNGMLQDVVVSIQQTSKEEPSPKLTTSVSIDHCRFQLQGHTSNFVGVVSNGGVIRVRNRDADPSDPKMAAGVPYKIQGYEVNRTNSSALFDESLSGKGQELEETITLRGKGSFMKLASGSDSFMEAWFYPVENRYYAIVGEDGRFRIGGVPAGKYKIVAWHPVLGIRGKEIAVSESGTVTVNFEFGETADFPDVAKGGESSSQASTVEATGTEAEQQHEGLPDGTGGDDLAAELLDAAAEGETNTVDLLLERGASIEARDQDGYTPLMLAAVNGDAMMVSRLLRKGAKIDATDSEGETALIVSAKVGRLKSAQALLRGGADTEAKDREGDTPLIIAAANGDVETATVLLEKGADTQARDNAGRTPLARAVAEGQGDVARLLQGKMTPREVLNAYVAALQAKPEDQGLRETIIDLARAMKPEPAVPEEADQLLAKALGRFKTTKESEADYANLAKAYHDFLRMAPWVAEDYSNLAQIQERLRRYPEASESYRFYLLANPEAQDAERVRAHIRELEAVADTQSAAKESDHRQ